MDATLSLGLPRLNLSGTLLEGIALWGELKPTLTHEAVIERALRYCDLAVSQGLLAVRSHVDICDDRLLAVAIHSYQHQNVSSLQELNPSILDQLEQFFVSYNKLRGKKFKLVNQAGPKRAMTIIKRGIEAFDKKKAK